MRILITGHSGMIGSHLAKRLVSEGHQVYGASRTERNNVEGVESYYADLRNLEMVKTIVEKVKPEVVYHLAANAAESRGQVLPIDMTTNGYNTFVNVLTASINAGSLKRFIYTSSAAVYGNISVPYYEFQHPEPEDVYGVTKLANEMKLKIMAKVHKFEYVIFRPHNVFGPGQDMRDPYRNVVTLFMNKLLRGEPYTIFGKGDSTRCFSYVDDVAEVLAKAVNADVINHTINVGSDKVTTLKELSNLIQEISGINIEPTKAPDRPQDVKFNSVAHCILKKTLGYHETPLKEALQKTWDYCKEKGAQEPLFVEPEIK